MVNEPKANIIQNPCSLSLLCTCLVVWFTRSSTCSFVCSYAKLVRWDTNALLLRQPKATHFIVFVFSHLKSVPDTSFKLYTERTTFDYFYQRSVRLFNTRKGSKNRRNTFTEYSNNFCSLNFEERICDKSYACLFSVLLCLLSVTRLFACSLVLTFSFARLFSLLKDLGRVSGFPKLSSLHENEVFNQSR